MVVEAPTVNQDWRAESDSRALVEAEDIRADRRRLQAARRHLKKQARNITRALGRPAARRS